MSRELEIEEIDLRMAKFRAAMDARHPDWDTAVFVSKINQYYFTGTMQDGLLLIRRDGEAVYFVRRSYERALEESPFKDIRQIRRYRDAAAAVGAECGSTYIESEIMTIAILGRFEKYFKTDKLSSLDKTILSVRAVKTPYEIDAIERAGKIHHIIMRDVVPSLLREGMSETELSVELLAKMFEHGFHGSTRFQMFQTDLGMGQIGFGTNALYPTYFDGPGGSRGLSAAVPMMGSREHLLRRGETIFVDIGFGIQGYNSDKSQVYIFGATPTEQLAQIQEACIGIQKRIAAMLLPGARPSEIYREIMGSLSDAFKKNFMGFGSHKVKFLGHGIGLHVDEPPVIAEGFDEPIEENMVFAVEPKKGIEGVGLIGVEDTYIVTKNGGRCVTGGGCPIIEVPA